MPERTTIRRPALALLLCGILACWSGVLRADHFSGASITYQCNGGNMYTVFLDLYLDCEGTPLTPQTLHFSNSCGVVFTLNDLLPVIEEEVSPLCQGSLVNSTCNGGTLPGFRRYRFETTLFLSPCNFWTISWSICCRNTSQNVVGVPGTYVEATLNNAGGVCDDSPVFADSGIPYICVGNDLMYSPGVSDPNGNTMVFSLIDARHNMPPPVAVNYQAGFTGAEPFPGMTIDPNTGQLNFSPGVSGNYVVVIEVATYNAGGQLIGTVMRDLMFVAVPCDGSPPSTDGLTNAQNALITSANALEVCDGVAMCVDLTFTDTDPGNVISIVSDAINLLPGSTFTLTGTTPSVTATLCWTPDASLLPITIYVQAQDGQCPIMNMTSTSFIITESEPPPTPPDAGTDGDVSSCVTGPPIPLFPLLGGTPDAGGVWLDPDGNSHSGTFDPAVHPFGDYTYQVGSACDNAMATVSVTESAGGDAGIDGALTLCATDAPEDLFDHLGGTPAAGGQWNGPGGQMTGIYDPDIHDTGVYTYTLVGGPCPGANATVTVTEIAAPNAGTDATVNLCTTSPPTDLFNALGAGTQAGGAWAGPSAITGIYDPALHAPGDYTYTVTGAAPCGDATATVTVIENVAPNTGTNANLNICADADPVDLFTILNGAPQVGGVWAGPGGPMDGNYDPAIHGPGNYSYTIAGVAPCANSTSFVIVTETAPSSAGEDAAIDLCSDAAIVDLLTVLGGTPDAGGTWTGPSPLTGMFDPAQHDGGVYTYTVTGPAVCGPATAEVIITLNTAPDAGEGAMVSLCENSAAIDLFSELSGTPDAGGVWSGPSMMTGVFEPALHAPGNYIYTVVGFAPCTDASATVTVVVNGAADAGGDALVQLCDGDDPVDLFNALTGTPGAGGTWSGPGVLTGGIFDPAVDMPGVYTYTVDAIAPCVPAAAEVTIEVDQTIDAGEDVVLDLCSDAPAVDLFGALGGTPQSGGDWTGPSTTTGTYVPGVDLPGEYIYTITSTSPCGDPTATVTINETPAAVPGTMGNISLCSDDAAIDLFTVLGGTPQPGGSWTGPSAINGVFDPALHAGGIYIYTVTAIDPCMDASATVTVTLAQAAIAGEDGVVEVCASSGPVDLFAELGPTAQPGGTWSGPDMITGTYDPAIHTSGDYTYTVDGTGSCEGASAVLTVNEIEPADAGEDALLDLCSNAASVDLFGVLEGTPDAGGTWNGPSGTTGGLFDASIHLPGDHTYSIDPGAPCPIATATVTVNVEVVADAGSAGSITVCDLGAPVDLFGALGGTPDLGGVWDGPSTITGSYDPQLHEPGIYTYSHNSGTLCPASTATVTVVETGTPDAGDDAVVSVCSSDDPVDLFGELGGTPDPGGQWSGPVSGFTGMFDPAQHPEGIYTYSIDAIAPCISDQSELTVLINPAPDAGSDGAITICDNGGAINLFSSLGGTPQAGGSWTGPNGVFQGMYDPAMDVPGDYTYTIAGSPPCGTSSATVSVTQTSTPNAGTDASTSLCISDPPAELFDLLGGNPDPGGTWSGPSSDMTGSFDPSIHVAGAYTYTIAATPPCGNDASIVTVSIIEGADAGENSAIALCEAGSPTDLFEVLGGTPQAGGTWSGPSTLADGDFDPMQNTPGVYVYTVTSSGACGSASAEVVVSVTSEPFAGEDAMMDLCSEDAAVDLFDLLGGSPDQGGTWDGPVSSGIFDPAVHASGVFTYTIAAAPPCLSDAATVTVNVETAADAGSSANLDLCPGAAPQDLFTMLGGDAQAGGNWSGPSPSFTGVFDLSVHVAGIYEYTVTGTQCPDASATITVTLLEGADSGVDAQISLCSTDTPIDMTDQLGGDPDANGTWTNSSGIEVPAMLDPSVATSDVFTYSVSSSGGCPPDQATLQVTISSAPQAGISGILELCSDAGQVSLFDGLTGTLDAGGIWTDPNGLPHATVVDPQVDIPGTYQYTVISGSCPEATSTVNLIIFSAPDAGGNTSVAFCSSDDAISLFGLLNGDPDQGGAWEGPDGEPAAAMFVPQTSIPGTYTYTVSGNSACGMDQATVTIDVSTAPYAGTGSAITLCANDDAVDLFTLLGGDPDTGGQWSTPDGVPFDGMYQPANGTGGAYTYTLEADAPCAMAFSAVMVDLLPVPEPQIHVTNSDACAPIEVTISHDHVGTASCTWILGNGEVVQECGPITTTFEEAGSYDVTLIIDPENGCTATTIQEIGLVNVYERPVAEFEALPDVIGTQDPNAYFHNYSQGATSYLWDMDGTGTYTSTHVNHAFPAELGDEYDVCLIAYASPQCADTICKVVTVGDALIVHVPNAFSPDDDGINDMFRPILEGIDPERYHFDIFDRWGSPIFSTRDPNASWDGRSASGDETPQGVYVWKLNIKDSFSGKRIERIGHVSLIR